MLRLAQMPLFQDDAHQLTLDDHDPLAAIRAAGKAEADAEATVRAEAMARVRAAEQAAAPAHLAQRQAANKGRRAPKGGVLYRVVVNGIESYRSTLRADGYAFAIVTGKGGAYSWHATMPNAQKALAQARRWWKDGDGEIVPVEVVEDRRTGAPTPAPQEAAQSRPETDEEAEAADLAAVAAGGRPQGWDAELERENGAPDAARAAAELARRTDREKVAELARHQAVMASRRRIEERAAARDAERAEAAPAADQTPVAGGYGRVFHFALPGGPDLRGGHPFTIRNSSVRRYLVIDARTQTVVRRSDRLDVARKEAERAPERRLVLDTRSRRYFGSHELVG
jgi:hypothetical protein